MLGRRVPAPPPSEKSSSPDDSKTTAKDEKDSTSRTTSPSHEYIYEIHQLSQDQNGYNPKEEERLKALHPDEPNLIKKGRLLGWGCARAFGDGSMKWSVAVRERLSKEIIRSKVGEDYKTPPYFTAEPEITIFDGVKKGDFVVMASDGLWECLTNEEVVGLVGKWLEERGVTHTTQDARTGRTVELKLPAKALQVASTDNKGAV